MEITNTSLLSVRKKKSSEWVGSKLLNYHSAKLDKGIKKGRNKIPKDLF